MLRNNKVIFLAHCLINQNCVVSPYARAKGAYKEIVNLLIDNGIGIELLPCPETLYSGILRLPQTKEKYETPEYRAHCKKLAKGAMEIIKHYLEADIYVIGIIGVGSSPTCDISGKENGIFMEELKKILSSENVHLPYLDISEEFQEDADNSKELKNLKNWIEG